MPTSDPFRFLRGLGLAVGSLLLVSGAVFASQAARPAGDDRAASSPSPSSAGFSASELLDLVSRDGSPEAAESSEPMESPEASPSAEAEDVERASHEAQGSPSTEASHSAEPSESEHENESSEASASPDDNGGESGDDHSGPGGGDDGDGSGHHDD